MEKQLMGEQVPLQKNSPLEYQQSGKDAGHPLMQTSGAEKAPIARTPYNLNPINEGTGKPLFQSIASAAPLSHEPMKGWQSFPTPMSDRAKKQSR